MNTSQTTCITQSNGKVHIHIVGINQGITRICVKTFCIIEPSRIDIQEDRINKYIHHVNINQ
jgi:hypothetical protein